MKQLLKKLGYPTTATGVYKILGEKSISTISRSKDFDNWLFKAYLKESGHTYKEAVEALEALKLIRGKNGK
jgi:hypothetical protein